MLACLPAVTFHVRCLLLIAGVIAIGQWSSANQHVVLEWLAAYVALGTLSVTSYHVFLHSHMHDTWSNNLNSSFFVFDAHLL